LLALSGQDAIPMLTFILNLSAAYPMFIQERHGYYMWSLLNVQLFCDEARTLTTEIRYDAMNDDRYSDKSDDNTRSAARRPINKMQNIAVFQTEVGDVTVA